MFARTILPLFSKYLKTFPVVVLTGARQVGKTTFLKNTLCPAFRYVLLEDPDIREHATQDPRGFLDRYPPPVIFDEFQYAPQLVNYLQGIIDNRRMEKGRYILTGSQNFILMEQVTQSLAGRAGVLSLYGLSTEELAPRKGDWESESAIAQLILRGNLPELWQDTKIDPRIWLASYLRTYIERDVRNLAQVGDIEAFERFVRLCAIRTGQVLNISDLANDAGISPPTASRWLSLLKQTYQIHLVEPYYGNLSSRIRKAPKLYFIDTGLAAYLMGFRSTEALLNAPQYGSLFETLVIGDFLRRHSSLGEIPEHCYLDAKGVTEVDLLYRREQSWFACEIKSGRTITSESFRQLEKAKRLLGKKVKNFSLAAPVSRRHQQLGFVVLPWWEIGF